MNVYEEKSPRRVLAHRISAENIKDWSTLPDKLKCRFPPHVGDSQYAIDVFSDFPNVKEGDWVVELDDASLHHLSDDEFHSTYVVGTERAAALSVDLGETESDHLPRP